MSLPKSGREIDGRKRYALCGLSVRAINHFLLPLLGRKETPERFLSACEVVGILDIDRDRVERFNRQCDTRIPYFDAVRGVDEFIAETSPDVVLVAGPDYTHCDHIVAGLRHDLRVVAEKPVVVNCEQMKAVLAAEKASEGSLVVAHNFRYNPILRKIKECLMGEAIGRVTNIELIYNLDTFHGASYFYRWNRERAKSGGLSIHKSVHHLDAMNWLVQSPPEQVFAFGALNNYGAASPHRPKAKKGSPSDVSWQRENCPFFAKHFAPRGASTSGLMKPGWDPLDLPYAAQYPEGIYLYDEAIDVEDTYSAVVRYKSGVSLSYSCNFSSAWEGFRLGINGTHGRIETEFYYSHPNHVEKKQEVATVSVFPLFGPKEEYEVQVLNGEHGGADPLIRNDIFFKPSAESLRLGLPSDSRSGAYAIAVGEAIWRSIAENRIVSIDQLLAAEREDLALTVGDGREI